jgi:hypothetical protein
MTKQSNQKSKGRPARARGGRSRRGRPADPKKHPENATRPRGGGRPRVPDRAPQRLQPIHTSKHSIHSHWMKQLGGLIRWYAHKAHNDVTEEAVKEVGRMYTASGCQIEETRNAILSRLGAHKQDEEQWIDVSMMVQQTTENTDTGSTPGQVQLPVCIRPGEGPAHSSDLWNTTLVPSWGVGKSYHVQVVNRSNIHLACEMTIDGNKVAWNAPIPAKANRYIKPETRYYGQHLWVLQPARRIKLQEHAAARGNQETRTAHDQGQVKSRAQRYNGKRPNHYGQRVSIIDYPDPSNYGWTFTGSVEDSRVEFYEQNLNLGTVKMDFYFTTGTVKTILEHPTTGVNQLFRRCLATPEMFQQILGNPRVHTSIGYRTRDQMPAGGTTDEPMMEQDDNSSPRQKAANGVFFAKNDDYDFEKEGHANRQVAMAQLQPSGAFQLWEEVARSEWACIHAKFYISQAQQKKRIVNVGQKQKSEPLPSMKPVVDVKATEKAALSTDFHALGQPMATRSSNVHMKRISLNDDNDWKSGPVFEYKLYYRPESVPAMSGNDSAESDDEMEDEEDAVPLADKLVQSMPLDTFKAEKLQQLNVWYSENNAMDQDQAGAMLRHVRQSIESAQDTGTVDEVMKVYWDWHQKLQWTAKDAAALAGSIPPDTFRKE